MLETYEKPYDPACPVICREASPAADRSGRREARTRSLNSVQLITETRVPIAGTSEHPRRIDDEDERAGTANLFMFTEPLSGWREATARERKTKVDWAIEVARLLEGRYAYCPQVILVSDNFNTHTIGAFDEAFEPERARALVRRIQFCHTPKHGSWLNIAENELSSLTRQCVATRRSGDLETLQWEIAAWSSDVNSTQRGVDWHMKIDDARWKLKSVSPKIKT